jgi:hypothetical protein
MVLLGGIIMPTTEVVALIAAENDLVYFCFTISGIRILPVEAASATDEPDTPAIIILTTTETQPNAPGNLPIILFANLIILLATPDCTIKFPDKIKNGTAKKGKDCVFVKNFWATIDNGIPSDKIYINAEIPMLNAIGRPIIIKRKKIIIIIQII